MNKNLVPTSTCTEIAQLDRGLIEQAAEYARAARSEATKRAYSADWRDWESWCGERGAIALPSTPEVVGLYIADLAVKGRKVSTISRRAVAICQAHHIAGEQMDMKHPAIREVLAGIRRSLGTKKEAKTALLTPDIRRCVAAMPGTLIGVRDRAVLLLLFAAALRRSELAALELADITLSSRRVTVTIRRAKPTRKAAAPRSAFLEAAAKPARCGRSNNGSLLPDLPGAVVPLYRSSRPDRRGAFGRRGRGDREALGRARRPRSLAIFGT